MKRAKIFVIVLSLLFVVGLGLFVLQTGNDNNQDESTEDLNNTDSSNSDQTSVEVIVEGIERPWDIKLSSTGDIYFTQRQLGLYKYDGEVKEIYLPEDLYNTGEGGMLGFDLSPNFEQDREVYACFNSRKSALNLNVVVAKLTLNQDLNAVENRVDIITDIPSAISGRHSGCRVRFDRNDSNVIWITTGDSAKASNPQDPESLGGKVLRVDREGKGVDGNLEELFDSRIFSYGHRNIQGITLFDEYNDEYGYGFTSEHGPNVDDEINPLVNGNFGWDPISPYIESVPMTDLDKYPEAIESLWSSGDRTIAICGIEYIEQGKWQGDLLVAALKDSYILRFDITEESELVRGEEIVNDYGRIRQIYQAPNGRIFFSTDNGEDDIIAEIK
jgi:glucose/arabinose dehydrogenase